MSTEDPIHVIVVDDEAALVKALELALRRAGMHASAFQNPEEALAAVWDDDVDVLLTDVRMAGLSGLDLLRTVKARKPQVEVVMMSGFATVQTAVEAVKGGAYDYLTKPFGDVDEVIRTVRKAADRKRLVDRNRDLERQLAERKGDLGIVGRSPKMEELRRLIRTVAPSHSTVLVRGESGVGKELVARALHDSSDRGGRPFVPVNCSALTDTLLESELFGHVKGSFTGATQTRRGLFEAASGGTIFLDEIGDISQAVQVRLLRVLQDGEIRKVGSQDAEKIDVRVVAATHVDLERAVQSGKFRQDLYYRLNVISMEVPPLRERPEDVPVLAQHFLAKFAAQARKPVKRLSADFLEAIVAYAFPGNVRELENLVERAVVLAPGDELTRTELPAGFRGGAASEGDLGSLADLPYAEARKVMLRGFERRYFSALLRRANGNITAASRSAAMDRSNFRRALKASGLRPPAGEAEAEEHEGGDGEPVPAPGPGRSLN